MNSESMNSESMNSDKQPGDHSFEAHLLEEGYAEATADRYARHAAELSAWAEAEGTSGSDLSYRDVVAWLRSLDGSAATRDKRLRAARHWLGWLKERGERTSNPAAGLSVRGRTYRLPQNILTPEQLDRLYAEQPAGSRVEKRSKAMLGLLVYQGITTGELALLRAEHLDLEAATARVPSDGRSKARRLRLEARQILPLSRYMETVRPALMEKRGKPCDRLFFTIGETGEIENALVVLRRRLRKRHEWFVGSRQLRASRIVAWIKQEGLRTAQHRAGHRQVSSTERYRQASQEDLIRAVEKHHPLAR